VCAEANFGRFNSFKCKKSFANASYWKPMVKKK
jgi:hypothetical protein